MQNAVIVCITIFQVFFTPPKRTRKHTYGVKIIVIVPGNIKSCKAPKRKTGKGPFAIYRQLNFSLHKRQQLFDDKIRVGSSLASPAQKIRLCSHAVLLQAFSTSIYSHHNQGLNFKTLVKAVQCLLQIKRICILSVIQQQEVKLFISQQVFRNKDFKLYVPF
ncbi:hypothetical protein D3C87_1252190 [compost metagenome]